MEDFNKEKADCIGREIEKQINIEYPECIRADQGRKGSASTKAKKTYKVVVTYIPISEEEAKTKLSIIENIIRRGYYK